MLVEAARFLSGLWSQFVSKLYTTPGPGLALVSNHFRFGGWNLRDKANFTWVCGEGDMNNTFKRLERFENPHKAEIVGPFSDEWKHHKEALMRFC